VIFLRYLDHLESEKARKAQKVYNVVKVKPVLLKANESYPTHYTSFELLKGRETTATIASNNS